MPGLRTDEGDPYDSPAEVQCTAPEIRARPDRRLKQASGLDFALPTLAPPGSSTRPGVFQVHAGDYALDSGSSAFESNVLRRLRCPRGGFAWLPDYGVGLEPKSLVSAGRLLAAKRRIEEQVLREPQVKQVAPRLAYSPGGVLQVDISIERSNGQQQDVSDKLYQ